VDNGGSNGLDSGNGVGGVGVGMAHYEAFPRNPSSRDLKRGPSCAASLKRHAPLLIGLLSLLLNLIVLGSSIPHLQRDVSVLREETGSLRGEVASVRTELAEVLVQAEADIARIEADVAHVDKAMVQFAGEAAAFNATEGRVSAALVLSQRLLIELDNDTAQATRELAQNQTAFGALMNASLANAQRQAEAMELQFHSAFLQLNDTMDTVVAQTDAALMRLNVTLVEVGQQTGGALTLLNATLGTVTAQTAAGLSHLNATMDLLASQTSSSLAQLGALNASAVKSIHRFERETIPSFVQTMSSLNLNVTAHLDLLDAQAMTTVFPSTPLLSDIAPNTSVTQQCGNFTAPASGQLLVEYVWQGVTQQSSGSPEQQPQQESWCGSVVALLFDTSGSSTNSSSSSSLEPVPVLPSLVSDYMDGCQRFLSSLQGEESPSSTFVVPGRAAFPVQSGHTYTLALRYTNTNTLNNNSTAAATNTTQQKWGAVSATARVVAQSLPVPSLHANQIMQT
jgi:hypothetical protein